MTIELKHCQVSWTDYGCITRFKDGTEVGCYPHWDDKSYHVIADRCGYGFDLLAYAREHDLCHHLVSEWLLGERSAVLYGVATGRELTGPASAYEEMAAQAFQRFLRANERPILSGLPKLDQWKAQALAMIEAENATLKQAA